MNIGKITHTHMATVVLVVALLAGCSTIPDSIQTQQAEVLQSYAKGSEQNQQMTIGSMVRWGGAVVDVRNRAEVTDIEMVFFPLNGYARPQASKESPGRFIARIDGFVDPMVVTVNRLVTVLGILAEPEAAFIGEQEYLFPVIEVSGHHLWPEVSEYDVTNVHFGAGWHGFHGFHPYFRSYYPFPHHPTVIRVKRPKPQIPATNVPSRPAPIKPAVAKPSDLQSPALSVAPKAKPSASSHRPVSSVDAGGRNAPQPITSSRAVTKTNPQFKKID